MGCCRGMPISILRVAKHIDNMGRVTTLPSLKLQFDILGAFFLPTHCRATPSYSKVPTISVICWDLPFLPQASFLFSEYLRQSRPHMSSMRNSAYFAIRHEPHGGQTATIAEMATCQMEYYYLAKATNNKEFFDLASGFVLDDNRNAKCIHRRKMLTNNCTMRPSEMWEACFPYDGASERHNPSTVCAFMSMNISIGD